MSFSERMGLKASKQVIQVDSMDDDLRNSIWNFLYEKFFGRSLFLYGDERTSYRNAPAFSFSQKVWSDFFKEPADNRPDESDEIIAFIREWFFAADWNEIYDFLEFTIQNPPLAWRELEKSLNQILQRELSGFRCLNGDIIPVSSEAEIAAIETALDVTPYVGVKKHLQTAIEHLSNRTAPDYRGSIRESTHAVESLCQELTGNPKATLGDALKILERSGQIHGALKKGMSSFYGYASNEQGIRHAMLQEPNITLDDAKYFLVVCSAFVNYMISKTS